MNMPQSTPTWLRLQPEVTALLKDCLQDFNTLSIRDLRTMHFRLDVLVRQLAPFSSQLNASVTRAAETMGLYGEQRAQAEKEVHEILRIQLSLVKARNRIQQLLHFELADHAPSIVPSDTPDEERLTVDEYLARRKLLDDAKNH